MKHRWARRGGLGALGVAALAALAILLLPLALLPGFRHPLAAGPDSVGLAFESASIASPGAGDGEAPDPPAGAPTGRNLAPDVAAAVAYAHARLPQAPVYRTASVSAA